MPINSPSIVLVLVLITHRSVDADFCTDSVSAEKCFDDKLIPMAIAATVAGLVFCILIVLSAIFIFCKTKMKNETPQIHETEQEDGLKDSQDFDSQVSQGIDNKLWEYERRTQGLGHGNLQHFPSKRSYYSERETAAVPSNASQIMDAVDSIQDQNAPESSEYYWAPDQREKSIIKEAEPEDDDISKHKVQVSQRRETKHL